ncbi:MAG: hypothetical protein ACRDOT_03455 [Aeromicrobium sp.]
MKITRKDHAAVVIEANETRVLSDLGEDARRVRQTEATTVG